MDKIMLYAITGAEGETAMVLAPGLLYALDYWRAEFGGDVWPVSIAMIHDGMILGENN